MCGTLYVFLSVSPFVIFYFSFFLCLTLWVPFTLALVIRDTWWIVLVSGSAAVRVLRTKYWYHCWTRCITVLHAALCQVTPSCCTANEWVHHDGLWRSMEQAPQHNNPGFSLHWQRAMQYEKHNLFFNSTYRHQPSHLDEKHHSGHQDKVYCLLMKEAGVLGALLLLSSWSARAL